MYMGDTTEAAPTARPPRKRAAANIAKLGASAVRRRRGEHGGDEHEDFPAAEDVGHPAGHGRTCDAAEQQRAEPPTQLQFAEMEVLLDERAGSGDDGDVKSEQQAAQRGRQGEKQKIGRPDFTILRFGHGLPPFLSGGAGFPCECPVLFEFQTGIISQDSCRHQQCHMQAIGFG
jgi:hypothetical protein